MSCSRTQCSVSVESQTSDHWTPSLTLYLWATAFLQSNWCNLVEISLLNWIQSLWIKNSVDPDQLVSAEASWSGSTLFSKRWYRVGEFVFNVPSTAKVIWRQVSSDRLEEPVVKLGTPGYKQSGWSTTPRRLLKRVKHYESHIAGCAYSVDYRNYCIPQVGNFTVYIFTP